MLENQQFLDFKIIKIAGRYAIIWKCLFIGRFTALGQHVHLVAAVGVILLCFTVQLFAPITERRAATLLSASGIPAYQREILDPTVPDWHTESDP